METSLYLRAGAYSLQPALALPSSCVAPHPAPQSKERCPQEWRPREDWDHLHLCYGRTTCWHGINLKCFNSRDFKHDWSPRVRNSGMIWFFIHSILYDTYIAIHISTPSKELTVNGDSLSWIAQRKHCWSTVLWLCLDVGLIHDINSGIHRVNRSDIPIEKGPYPIHVPNLRLVNVSLLRQGIRDRTSSFFIHSVSCWFSIQQGRRLEIAHERCLSGWIVVS